MAPPISRASSSIRPSISFDISPTFEKPLVISVDRPTFGLHLPVFANHPFLVQPPMIQNNSILVDSRVMAAKTEFHQAVSIMGENPEEAGRLFTIVRDDRREVARRLLGSLDQLYVESTFGSALLGKVTEVTFEDLRRVRKRAKAIGDTATMAREMLVRAVAHSRINDDEAAMDVLDRLLETAEAKNPLFRINLLMMRANLLMNHADRHTGIPRSFSLNTLADMMKNDFSASVKQLPNGEGQNADLLASLAKFYVFTAEYMLEQRRPLDAKEIVNAARRIFPDDATIENLFAVNGAIEDGPSSVAVSPLHRLLTDQPTAFDHMMAGATQLFRNAEFENNRTFWSYAVKGALAGTALIAGGAILTDTDPSMMLTMMGSAVGATGAVTVGKFRRGITAPETGQAFITGYNTDSFSRAFFKEAAKLLATYAVFGGIVPGASALDSGLMATDSGQFHGLGSLFSYVFNSAAFRTEEFVHAVSQSGLVDGAGAFWNHWVDTSLFARTLNNGFTLPFDNTFERLFRKSKWDMLPEWIRTVSFDSPMEMARSLGVMMLYGYMGISGLFAFASMNPVAADYLKKRVPDKAVPWLFLGAFLATDAAMIASGIEPASAPILALWNYAIQHRHWVQGGGEYNIFRKSVREDLPWMTYATAGAVQLLYIAPGNAIAADIPKIAQAGGIGPFLWNTVEVNAGMVGFLASLGVLHAIFTGLNIKQTLKAKYAKAWTYEVPANAVKLIAGWNSLLGNLIGPFIKEVGFGAPVTNVFREAGNSRIQRAMVMKIIAAQGAQMRAEALNGEPVQGEVALDSPMLELQQQMVDSANSLHDAGVQAALRGEAYGYLNVALTGHPISEQLLILPDIYFMEDDRRLLLRPDIRKDRYNDIIYRALTDPVTPSSTIEEYFRKLFVIAADVSPEQRHIRYNLIISTMRAMAGKAHGATIEQFFTDGQGRQLIEAYNLQSIFEEIKAIPRDEGANAWRGLAFRRPAKWIEKHVLRLGVTPEDRKEKKVDRNPTERFYDAATVAGRRYDFPAPFTGRNIVQNLSPFSSLMLSASQTDVAFQTRADPTFFAGTIYGYFMTPVDKAQMTRDGYVKKIIEPLLELVRVNTSGNRLGDNRRDVRHNLLVTVWLASQGPYGDVLRKWMDLNKHIYQANGIYGMLKVDGVHLRLPGSLSERRVIRDLVKRFLWNSDNSADGVIVYPVQHGFEVASDASQRSVSSPGTGTSYPAAVQPRPQTQTPIYGTPAGNLLNINQIPTGMERQRLIDTTGKFLVEDIFRDGIFYSEYTPENLKWWPGETGQIGRPVFLDMERTGRLTESQRSTLARLILAIQMNDMVDISRIVIAMTDGVLAGGGGNLTSTIKSIMERNDRISAKLMELFNLAAGHTSNFEPNYFEAVNAIISWEKMLTPIDPDVDFSVYAIPFIKGETAGTTGQGGASPAATPQASPAPQAPPAPAAPVAPRTGAPAMSSIEETVTESTPAPSGADVAMTSTVTGLVEVEYETSGGAYEGFEVDLPSETRQAHSQVNGARMLYQRGSAARQMRPAARPAMFAPAVTAVRVAVP